MSDTLNGQVAVFESLVQLQHLFIHGDENTDVPTDNGPVPSIAKAVKEGLDITGMRQLVEETAVVAAHAVTPEQLNASQGATLVGHRDNPHGVETTVARELRDLRLGQIKVNAPAMQDTVIPFTTTAHATQDYTVLASGTAGVGRYLHSPRMVRGLDGRLHLVYSSGRFHGFGGLVESNYVDPQGAIIYRHSDDNGRTWSPEEIVCTALPPDAINIVRTVFDCHVGVCPSGRVVVVVSDIPPPSSQWGRDTGDTKYRWFINDERGAAGAWVDKGVFFTAFDDYARIYCSSIKMIPKEGGGSRMAFCDYRRYSNAPSNLYMIGMWYTDDEFETAPVEGAPIMQGSGANTETDFTFPSAKLGVSVSRSDMGMRITRDGGASWTKVGTQANYPAPVTGECVAPILDTVWHGGAPHVVLSYTERTGVRSIRFLVAPVTEIFNYETAVINSQAHRPWGLPNIAGPQLFGSAGYNSNVWYEDGSVLYVDCSETSASPTTGYMRSDIRLVRVPTDSWFPRRGGIILGDAKTSRLTVYERNERALVPTLNGSVSAGAPVYTSQFGTGVRVGDLYIFGGQMGISALGGLSGGLRIDGLPYAYGNNPHHWLVNVVVTSGVSAAMASGFEVVGIVINNQKYIQLYKRNRTTGALAALDTTDLTGTSFSCYFSGQFTCRYEVEP